MKDLSKTPAHFIVNPNASNERCGKIWKRSIERRIGRSGINYVIHITDRPGHATEISRELCIENKGDCVIIGVGGDGTHNEVATGIITAEQKKAPVLGCLTLGTGGDFRKTLALPKDPFVQLNALLEDIRDSKTKAIDLGRLEYTTSDDNKLVGGFINIASFGVGGQIDKNVNESSKMLGGFASFLLGSIRTTLTYDNQDVRVLLDGREIGQQRVFNVAVANGQYFGGGMHVAPDANPSDGLFDVVVLGDMNFLEQLSFMPKLYKGTHLDNPKVTFYRARKVEATSSDEVLLDVDGEQPGKLPATFQIVPEAVNLIGSR